LCITCISRYLLASVYEKKNWFCSNNLRWPTPRNIVIPTNKISHYFPSISIPTQLCLNFKSLRCFECFDLPSLSYISDFSIHFKWKILNFKNNNKQSTCAHQINIYTTIRTLAPKDIFIRAFVTYIDILLI